VSRISGTEIVRAREAVGDIYSETVTVLRPARTTDGKGGWTNAYTTVAQVGGRLASLKGSDAIAYQGELGSSEGFVLTLPRGYTLKAADRIRVRGITCEPIIDGNETPLRVAGRWICRKGNA
jgi:head-tail adaptor